ncbi:Uncharacterised protein [uncultured archaeon]|nr:Uncharacterised protein [uncultured archaeon]
MKKVIKRIKTEKMQVSLDIDADRVTIKDAVTGKALLSFLTTKVVIEEKMLCGTEVMSRLDKLRDKMIDINESMKENHTMYDAAKIRMEYAESAFREANKVYEEIRGLLADAVNKK